MDKISLANAHLPQLIGLVLMSIGYTLGNKKGSGFGGHGCKEYQKHGKVKKSYITIYALHHKETTRTFRAQFV